MRDYTLTHPLCIHVYKYYMSPHLIEQVVMDTCANEQFGGCGSVLDVHQDNLTITGKTIQGKPVKTVETSISDHA